MYSKHGYSHSRTYASWQSMKTRCYNKNYMHYIQYGGRGITVCDEWKNSFKKFLEDMGERPKGMSIDRINNDKGYCRENCKWSTPSQQMLNRNVYGTSKYRGVCWHKKRKKWRAIIHLKGVRFEIGSYDNEIEAALAVDDCIIKNNLPSHLNFK